MWPESNTRVPAVLTLAIAAVLALLTGCSVTAHVHHPFEYKPLIKQRNITVGVYYSKEFRDAVHVEKVDLGKINIPVGKANVKMLDEVFASAFDRVVKIKRWPVAATSKSEVDVVIVPTMEAFWVINSDQPANADFISPPVVAPAVWIRYKLEIYSPDGKIKDSQAVLAEGHYRFSGLNNPLRPKLSYSTERAIRDAAAKISVVLNNDREIDRLLETGTLITPVPSEVALVKAQEVLEPQESVVAFVATKSSQEVDVIDCVIRSIGQTNPSVRTLPKDVFREKLFPWFEPSIAPDKAEQMVSLLSRPLVRQKFNSLHIRYLVSIIGGTINRETKRPLLYQFECFGNFAGAGCFGLDAQERESNLTATVWDLKRAEILGVADSSATGTSFIAGFFLPIPVWHNAKPDATACEMLAGKLVPILRGGVVEAVPHSDRSSSTENVEGEYVPSRGSD